jgi:hypothetical protein
VGSFSVMLSTFPEKFGRGFEELFLLLPDLLVSPNPYHIVWQVVLFFELESGDLLQQPNDEAAGNDVEQARLVVLVILAKVDQVFGVAIL